jgi:hypothetical protein
MKKSEMVRAAADRVRAIGEGRRVCYCTPSREMALSLRTVALNENMPNAEHVVEEIASSLAEKLREATGRTAEHESLLRFDTEDTDAAYSLTDSIVRNAFEKTAQMYEEQGS